MKRTLLALTLLAALPFAASAADGVSYTYVEGGYAATNPDGSTDADGWALKGSGAIAPNFHLFGDFSNKEIDGTNFDFDQYRVGVGYNRDITANTDLLTRVAYEKYDFGQDLTADGFSVEAGVRSALAPNFEGYALAGYENLEDFDGNNDGEFYGRVGGLVKFNQTWGLSGDIKFADNYTEYFVGPRVSF